MGNLERRGVLIRNGPGTRWIERVVLLKCNGTLYAGKMMGKDADSEGPPLADIRYVLRVRL